ncbi:hypothetical protein F4679DRAFT_582540 [Xylaria curta]|nr:hypothetical protein F4679DRAFT_582540 [Xylaria curta]
MHAITTVQIKHTFPEDTEDPDGPDYPDDRYTEPFVDFNGIAEMGYAMEQPMFRHLAAIPIRKVPREQEEHILTGQKLQLNPNARAPTLPPINMIPNHRITKKSCVASELFDPINTGDEPIPVFDHIHILNVLRNAL